MTIRPSSLVSILVSVTFALTLVYLLAVRPDVERAELDDVMPVEEAQKLSLPDDGLVSPQLVSAILPPPPKITRTASTPDVVSLQQVGIKPLKPSATQPPPRPTPLLKFKPAIAENLVPLRPSPEPETEPEGISERQSAPPDQTDTTILEENKKPNADNVVEADHVTIENGRALLQILEHGSGPLVEIAWPPQAQERADLYAYLSDCYGMQSALMTRDGRLFTETSQVDQAWDINLDRYSSFVRTTHGAAPHEELAALKRIRSHHAGVTDVMPVRVFRRTVDAQLLGGLKRVIGNAYVSTERITARYVLRDQGVEVNELQIDGKSHAGAIFLPPLMRGCLSGRHRT